MFAPCDDLWWETCIANFLSNTKAVVTCKSASSTSGTWKSSGLAGPYPFIMWPLSSIAWEIWLFHCSQSPSSPGITTSPSRSHLFPAHAKSGTVLFCSCTLWLITSQLMCHIIDDLLQWPSPAREGAKETSRFVRRRKAVFLGKLCTDCLSKLKIIMANMVPVIRLRKMGKKYLGIWVRGLVHHGKCGHINACFY